MEGQGKAVERRSAQQHHHSGTRTTTESANALRCHTAGAVVEWADSHMQFPVYRLAPVRKIAIKPIGNT